MRGFTLIELLVAITVMALLAVLSWRGLDGMARAQSQTSQRADEVLTLQAGLAQWKLDLDGLAQGTQINSLDWDGRVMRITRRTASSGEGLQVVAWTRRSGASGQWLRWQSPVLRSAAAWSDAWAKAGTWSQTPSADDGLREVRIVPLDDWKIFYFRGGAWSNPLSSEGTAAQAPGAGTAAQNGVPDGIRLVLSLSQGQAVTGAITMDWVRPNLGGSRS